jgi:hypothetical protein
MMKHKKFSGWQDYGAEAALAQLVFFFSDFIP